MMKVEETSNQPSFSKSSGGSGGHGKEPHDAPPPSLMTIKDDGYDGTTFQSDRRVYNHLEHSVALMDLLLQKMKESPLDPL